jgi:ketosteroid isomerase-like protein
MSTQQRVQELISYVEQGRILDALDEFYADDVVMQDNHNPPTVGKAANVERERALLAGIAEVHENRAGAVLVDGDRAAINWRFEFTGADGRRYRFDQVALQTWRDGRIVRERFFYDSATLAAA